MPYNNSKDGGAAPMRRRPMHRRKKVCVFCSDSNQVIDYKDANLLRKYISERGKILPRRITGSKTDSSYPICYRVSLNVWAGFVLKTLPAFLYKLFEGDNVTTGVVLVIFCEGIWKKL